MKESKKAILSISLAFLILCAVSLYRQLSLRFLPDDAARPAVVYSVYVLLTIWWGLSLRRRITQKNIRVFLYGEVTVMLFWLTIRFIQDGFLTGNIYPMRVLGYFISIPAVAIPLLGMYASFGLGKSEDYRFPKRWYLLVIPALGLMALALTNEYHHITYSVAVNEPQPNLYFHPYIGIYLIYLWSLVLVAARIAIIFQRNHLVNERSFLFKIIPYCELVLLAAFCAPYTASSFWVQVELIEFSAGVFFIEAMGWETCIFIGLVPVNTQYAMVFDRSTVAMQIVTEKGESLLQSSRAPKLREGLFEQLKKEGTVSAEEGVELHLYQIHGGYLIWQKDVAKIQSVIASLRKNAEELEQEGTLLREELKTKSEEARIHAQNSIYDRITEEVGGQLSLLRELLKKRESAADKDALFRQICLIGTYVKRRCNLRLLEQETGVLAPEDLELSFRDMISCLSQMGTEAKISWSASPLSPEFSLFAFDVLEFLLEYERFIPTAVTAALNPDRSFEISICSCGAAAGNVPREEVERMNRTGCGIDWKTFSGGYRLILREGGV